MKTANDALGQQAQGPNHFPAGAVRGLPVHVTVHDAAWALAVSAKTIRRCIDRGDIGYIRVGSRIRIPREEFLRFVRETPLAAGGGR